jgi:pimeloyl-ACP methyl ester carboxylesterase
MSEISPATYRAGAGEPVVLLHGFTAAWRIWHPILADLVARYEVIAPTLPGHHGGPSYPDDHPIGFEHSTDAVERLLDELGVGTAHFVGNSMGGGIALELAKRGRARSVVAFAPAGGWSAGDGEGPRIGRFFARQIKMLKRTHAWSERIMRRRGLVASRSEKSCAMASLCLQPMLRRYRGRRSPATSVSARSKPCSPTRPI